MVKFKKEYLYNTQNWNFKILCRKSMQVGLQAIHTLSYLCTTNTELQAMSTLSLWFHLHSPL